ncbi:MAG: hypothetical protein HYZ86_00945 [Candidatus Omnitrophica bacterium]|nr:hypothetical protein [Candidatus Omnitrophota bacterium]
METVSAKNKLTLWLDRETITFGKNFARQNHKSLSQIIYDYLRSLKKKAVQGSEIELTPIVRRMSGIAGSKKLDVKEYYRHLEKKHLHG